jgi:hypothetical protein
VVNCQYEPEPFIERVEAENPGSILTSLFVADGESSGEVIGLDHTARRAVEFAETAVHGDSIDLC